MDRWEAHARDATMRALRVRKDLALGLDGAVSPVDIAISLGIQLRFEALPSLEGLYTPGPPATIILGSLRPPGRRAYTCAHEIGHHLYDHGERVDQVVVEQERRPRPLEEFVADRFAAALLMPKLAVAAAFTRRGWTTTTATGYQAYVVASELGVGYRTLLGYMGRWLGLMTHDHAEELRRVQPKALKAAFGFEDAAPHVVVIDRGFAARVVDVEVGDVVLLEGFVDAGCAAVETHHLADGRLALRATTAGVVDFAGVTTRGQIRVARRAYHGLADFRHLEDDDETIHEAA